VTSPWRRTRRAGIRFHCSVLPPDEVTANGGVPVTTAPRTLFDLAGMVPYRQLERAVNEAEVRRLWDPVSLHDLLARHPRRPGAAAIRTVLAAGAGVTRSELEDRFLDFLQASNLPLPPTNLPLQVGGRWIEADCVWRDQRLIVELDGRAAHDTSAAFERDRYRDRALVAAGWRVIRVTWRQLRDEPEALGRDLRAALTLEPGS
jgi:REase_MTES_1575